MKTEIEFPTLHPAQVHAFRLFQKNRYVAVRCGRRWGKCIASGTAITYADGTEKPIENVKVGDVLFTLNETTGRLEAKPVIRLLDNGIKPVVDLVTEEHQISVTLNHPVLTLLGWKEVGDLSDNDHVAVAYPNMPFNNEIWWDDVVSVGNVRDEQTWDLALEDNHNFIANGIITHNTDLGKVIACDAAIRGQYVFWGAPAYKYIAEAFVEIARTLQPIVTQSSKIDGVIRTSTGGRIDFWSLDNERAGASRRYHKAIIDEAAFTKNSVMLDIWQRSIKPTLLDYQGKAIVLSNANGQSQKNFFYQICTNPEHNFIEYHSPSMDNPHVPKRETGESDEEHQKRRDAEFELLKATNKPLVFAQEYLADFVDWSGKSLFDIRNMLDEDGQAFDFPARCDYVFATIDSATKTGKKHDGTAVSMWAYSGYAPNGRNLLLLDWDIVQITGDLLISWLPTVFQSLDMYARQCGSRVGSFGAYIEDAASGMILLQQAQRLGYPVEAIDSKLTGVGKTERALNVSGHVYCGSVGISKVAHDKQTMYHGNVHNHWEYQVGQFKVGDTDPMAEDDLLDTATYGIAIALGDSRYGDA